MARISELELSWTVGKYDFMKSILTLAALACCLVCNAQTPADTVAQGPDHDVTLGFAFLGSAQGLYAGPQAVMIVSNKLRFENASAELSVGAVNSVADNTRLYVGAGIGAWTDQHLFEAGCMRYGIGGGKYELLNGHAENGWLFRFMYGYRTGNIYPFAEGTLLYANTFTQQYEQDFFGFPHLLKETTVHSQSWWIAAGGVCDREFSNHVLMKVKLGLGVDNSQQKVNIREENQPEVNLDEKRNAGMILVCEFGVGYRFRNAGK